MKKIQLPEKARRFLAPGVLLLVVFFIAGGFYFRQRSLKVAYQAAVPAEEGGVSGVQAGLPQNLPRDIFLSEPSQILSSHESSGRIQITFQIEASAGMVRELYQQKMEGFGWRLTGRGGENEVLTFTKNGRRLQITIIPGPVGPTLVILNTNP